MVPPNWCFGLGGLGFAAPPVPVEDLHGKPPSGTPPSRRAPNHRAVGSRYMAVFSLCPFTTKPPIGADKRRLSPRVIPSKPTSSGYLLKSHLFSRLPGLLGHCFLACVQCGSWPAQVPGSRQKERERGSPKSEGVDWPEIGLSDIHAVPWAAVLYPAEWTRPRDRLRGSSENLWICHSNGRPRKYTLLI